MSELSFDFGWRSICHDGEALCGDHVEVIRQENALPVMVLADGLGSGVKASILSTLTSKIISTMLSENLSLEACVSAIVQTLPIDRQKGVAYSTFTILRILDSQTAELIQFDNPQVIMLRNFNNCDYPVERLYIDGKKILRSVIPLQAGDIFVACSDGVTHASASNSYNYRWTRNDVADFVKIFGPVGYSAKTLATMLTEECDRLYNHHPLDDATAAVLRVLNKQTVNLFFGPPKTAEQDKIAMSRFFASEGLHVVCGGTTAAVAGRYLNKPVRPLDGTPGSDIPPMSAIDGLDLVTEGVITLNRVNEYAADVLGDGSLYPMWSTGQDGASRISRMLFEDATHVELYIGTAVNEAHQQSVFNSKIKRQTVENLIARLREMGKVVAVHPY